MKILLAACNAKYIHSNLAVFDLKAYAREYDSHVILREYTINQLKDDILGDIYRTHPDVVCVSCYIWNITFVKELMQDLRKILPGVPFWAGGPEVSYDAEEFLSKNPAFNGVMVGEGEETFLELVKHYVEGNIPLENIKGIVYHKPDNTFLNNGWREIMDLSKVPFVYEDLKDFENRIIYYESSRGCPFSCSYCLSSVDKRLRFRNLELVKKELQFFLDHKVPQVKFVDRTFNCKHDHAMAIWQYIKDHDNGITNFHFEVSADLLRENELELISTMRPGLIQLEIGVQSTNPDTIRAIHRTMDFEKLTGIVNRIHSFKNIHQHLDLIAGLPYEDYDSFHKSFNDVYALKPQQLQLGFLKVLKGSHMKEMTSEYQIIHKEQEPYEVLGTKWLSYDDILRLKMVESMVEVYYNSGQFQNTLACAEPLFEDAFTLYEKLGQFYERKGYSEISHSRMRRYEIFLEFMKEILENKYSLQVYGNGSKEIEEKLSESPEMKEKALESEKLQEITWEKIADSMIYDLYLRENLKSHPSFENDQKPYEKAIWEYRRQEKIPKTAHIEVFRDGKVLLFDYEKRDPLLNNADVKEIRFIKKPDYKKSDHKECQL